MPVNSALEPEQKKKMSVPRLSRPLKRWTKRDKIFCGRRVFFWFSALSPSRLYVIALRSSSQGRGVAIEECLNFCYFLYLAFLINVYARAFQGARRKRTGDLFLTIFSRFFRPRKKSRRKKGRNEPRVRFLRPQALKNGKSAGEALGGTSTPPRGDVWRVTKPLETVNLLLLLPTTYAIVDNCIYMVKLDFVCFIISRQDSLMTLCNSRQF